MIEKIYNKSTLQAIIIRAGYSKNGIEFFTPPDFSQQLGYMKRPKGYLIESHTHKIVERTVNLTQEVLFIKSGKVRVDFYDHENSFRESREVAAGDVLLLAAEGHGFEMLEESEIIEVKQGPYTGDEDKVRFTPNG